MRACLTLSRRWQIAVAGVMTEMMLGTVYAWSVFKKPLIARHSWPEADVGFTFMLVFFFLGVATTFGGKWVDKAGARTVASVAALLFSGGMILAGLADSFSCKWLLWVGYGVVGGLGAGLGYMVPIAVLVRWFPDRKGTITGLAVMGFGMGAAIMGQLAPYLMKVLHIGPCHIFYASGSLFLVIMLLAARKLQNPPADYSVPSAKTNAAPLTASVDVRTALKMYQFYILWGLMFLSVIAGSAILSNLSNMAQEQLKIDAVRAGTIVFSALICNSLGRVLWAALSEKIGCKAVFMLLMGTQIPLFFAMPYVMNVWLFAGMACYMLLCYGGVAGTLPSFTAITFGAKNIGGIYGKIMMALGVAGLVGPFLMEWVKKKSDGFGGALYVTAFVLSVAFVLAALYRRPKITGRSI
jgi:OFA family oxalate/formate antiporter-like MFS transporter